MTREQLRAVRDDLRRAQDSLRRAHTRLFMAQALPQARADLLEIQRLTKVLLQQLNAAPESP